MQPLKTTSEDDFCRVFTEYTGEKIDNPEQLTQYTMNGMSLYNFADFYFWNIYSKRLSDENRSTDDKIFRLKAVIVLLLFVLIALAISGNIQ